MSQYYLALTIGPIHKTMQMARKTREFWAASMLFSLLSKELCSELLKAGIQEDDFLVPDKTLFKKQVRNIGLYMDRIICRVSSTNFLAILENEIIYPALKKLAGSLNSVQGVDRFRSAYKSPSPEDLRLETGRSFCLPSHATSFVPVARPAGAKEQ